MSWLGILGVVVLLIALVSVLGLRPKGGRPASGTRLMAVARVVLVLIGLALLYFGRAG
jgi:hypothetical protein